MGKRLTVTELRVLAQEATNITTNYLISRENEVRNSDKYKNFEAEFKATDIGTIAYQLCESGAMLQKRIENELEWHKEHTYSTHDRCDFDVSRSWDKLVSAYRKKAFPELERESHEITMKERTSYQSGTLHDYFMHQLTLSQLTTDSDIKETLDKIIESVKSLIDQRFEK